MQIKTIFFFTVFLLNAPNLFGGTIRHDVDDKKYLEYGEKHECVVRLCCTTSDKITACGSGVIVKPRCVLTAAHVVKDCEDVHVFFRGKRIKMKKVVVKKEFKGLFQDNDIAVCISEEDINLDFYPELYNEKDELGKVCSISGFGGTGTGHSGATIFDGKKRGGSNVVDNTSEDMIYCTMNKAGSSLEYCIAHGDSGGGLFINNKLAGINSVVLAADKKPDSNYGDESGHTRISKYKEWIEKTIQEND